MKNVSPITADMGHRGHIVLLFAWICSKSVNAVKSVSDVLAHNF